MRKGRNNIWGFVAIITGVVIFLALILPTEHLLRILDYIRENLPECERVSVYASPKSVLKKLSLIHI